MKTEAQHRAEFKKHFVPVPKAQVRVGTYAFDLRDGSDFLLDDSYPKLAIQRMKDSGNFIFGNEKPTERLKKVSIAMTFRASMSVFIMSMDNGNSRGKQIARKALMDFADLLDETQKKNKTIKSLLSTLKKSCQEGRSGDWDCSTEEGKEGFDAMIKDIEDIGGLLW